MQSTKILIIEDDALVAHDISASLKNYGYEICEVASSACEALDMARRYRPTIVLMDIRLNGEVNGVQAATAIRDELNIPFIFLTAHSDKATLQQAKFSGASGYLLKPFDEIGLYTAIETAVGSAQWAVMARNSERMTTLGTMAKTLSHEINNPLTVICGNAALIKREVARKIPSMGKIEEYAKSITDAAQTASQVIYALDASVHGTPSAAGCKVALQAAVSGHLRSFQERCRQRNIDFFVGNIPAVWVPGGEAQITQILGILMENAIEAVAGLTERWIRVDGDLLNGKVHVRVTDSGRGISPEIAPRIMEPFFTTKGVGKGPGLGLTVARGVIEHLNGELRLETAVKNTSFCFALPVVVLEDPTFSLLNKPNPSIPFNDSGLK